jgi:hypothetical protein
MFWKHITGKTMQQVVVNLLVVWLSTSPFPCDAVKPGISVEQQSQAWQQQYQQAVEAYRLGHYMKALPVFSRLATERPEIPEVHYYWAITLAQLDRFEEARHSYDRVIRLAPHAPTARLAKEGLTYLPTAPSTPQQSLDQPPYRLSAPQYPSVEAYTPQPSPVSHAESPSPASQASGQAPQPTSPVAGMDPKAMEMMMMMSAMGGNGGGGFNPMMLGLLQQMGGGGQSGGQTQPAISPDMIRTMMMSQMMQNLSPFGSSKDD